MPTSFEISPHNNSAVLRLLSEDGTNRLTHSCVVALTRSFSELAHTSKPVIIAGNTKFFSVGADLEEIAALTGPAAYEFSKMGQCLMNAIEHFPAPVYAAIEGYCMGGGLDLALSCRHRIASPHAIFGHRGAALGLITGWGGTQRLPRLIGKSRALEMLLLAAKLSAEDALKRGLIDAIADDPLQEAESLATRFRAIDSA
jgi:enoyl-CoA hydratase/carnithine racemase